MEINLNLIPDKLDLPVLPSNVSHPSYFTLPTTLALVGTRGSGKTYALSKWLVYMFERMYFTRFFCISATYESNPTLHLIPTRSSDIYTDMDTANDSLGEIIFQVEKDAHWYQEMTKEYAKAYSTWIKKKQRIRSMPLKTMNYLFSKQKEIARYYQAIKERVEGNPNPNMADKYVMDHSVIPPELEFVRILNGTQSLFQTEDYKPWFFPPPTLLRPQPFLFIDDASHTPVYSTSRTNPLVNLVLRHRHVGGLGFGLSLAFAVQTFKSGVPKALRANTMQFLIFKTQDQTVLEDIWKEIGGIVGWEEFQSLYRRAIIEKHDFLLVDANASDERKAFRRGWDTILVRAKTIVDRVEAADDEEG